MSIYKSLVLGHLDNQAICRYTFEPQIGPVRSPSLCLLSRPPRFFQIEIEVYLYTTLITSHPYYPMSVC